jgi:hypothetical protein
MHLNRRNTLRHAVLASALGASLLASQIAGAQTSPGEERQPAGPPSAGDTRAIPGSDPKQGPAPRAGDERPLIRQPSDRTTNPNGAPNAGDTRAVPGGDTRPPRGASTGKDRDRTGAYTEPRSGAALGSAEKRPDGPDAGVAQSGVKP